MRVSGFGVRVSGGRKIAPAPSYYPKPQTRDPKPGYLIALSSSIAYHFAAEFLPLGIPIKP